jgi:hypothetical protein
MKRNRVVPPWWSTSESHETKGAFGNTGINLGSGKAVKTKAKKSKKQQKALSFRPGKWVTVVKNTRNGKTVRTKEWAYLDELKQ